MTCVALVTCHAAEKNGAGRVSASRDAVAITNDISVCATRQIQKTALDGMKLQQIADFRIQRVGIYKSLSIYPDNYNPLEGDGAVIYRSITAGADWVGSTPYYIANPYHLLNLVPANHATPLNVLCPAVSIVFHKWGIEEKRTGLDSKAFFSTVYSGEFTNPGKVRLMMVNAYDAGFRFACIDQKKSENIEPEPGAANIFNDVYSRACFYHVGRYKKNNISPEDRKAWLVLKKKDVLTRITVKLWKKAPASAKDDPDMLYVFMIEP